MKTVKGVVFVACLAFAAVGCSSSIKANCEKNKECGTLGDKTVEGCTKDAEDARAKFAAIEACSSVLQRIDETNACTAPLSCEDRKKDLSESPCKDEFEALTGALVANLEKCNPK